MYILNRKNSTVCTCHGTKGELWSSLKNQFHQTPLLGLTTRATRWSLRWLVSLTGQTPPYMSHSRCF